MNAITYNGAYSFFPRGTFEERIALYTAVREIKHAHAVQKYEKRGWAIKRWISPEEQMNVNSSFRCIKRWVGDKYSWTMKLPPAWAFGDPISTDSKLPDVFDGCSFNVALNAVDLQPEIRFVAYKDPNLEEGFVVNVEFAEKVKVFKEVIQNLSNRHNLDREACVSCNLLDCG